MEERTSEGQSSAGASSEEARMLPCARLAHARCACCAAGRHELRMDPPAKRSHHAGERLVRNAPECPYAMSSAWTPLSRAAVLVCCGACSLLFMRPVCSSCAPPAAHGRLRVTSTAASAATATISSIATHPQLLQPPLSRPRPRSLRRCSLRTQATTLGCRSCSAQQLSYWRSKDCREV